MEGLAMLKESLWMVCKHVKVHVNMSGFTFGRCVSCSVIEVWFVTRPWMLGMYLYISLTLENCRLGAEAYQL